MPNYYCQGPADLVDGRGARHMNVGGQAIDAAVAGAFLAALQPAALQACLQAAEQIEHGHDAALAQHRRQVEQARYNAIRAERRYRAVDPENRLVARGLETEWNTALQQVADAEAELARRQTARPKALTPAERAAILALGDDLGQVWDAPTTTDKDRKQLLRTLLEEVNITARRDDPDPHARLILRWKGGAISELTVPLRRPQPKIRTDEDTIALIRRLAVHYPDAIIAGILNRQHRTTARGMSFTANRVASLRTHWHISRHPPGDPPAEGELLNVAQAARELKIAPSTLLRWLNDGFIAGEQVTPGAPWRVRLTDQLHGMLTDNAPDGWLALHHASRTLGVSRQTVLQKVKHGELRAVLTRTGRRKGLRIEVPASQDGLF
ncbi:MAG TPA: helix-turn-helix domain-containing protein [Streptosporangiaceae bacterium]|nr:helix-turn-helix domain-containing protein [Streptosporangiaceae bacterium]